MLGMLARVKAMQKKAEQWRSAAAPEQENPEPPSLAAYWKARNPRYDFAPHIELICNTLENLKSGDCLLLNMPPRGSKTESVTTFLEWCLGKDNTLEAMYTGYSGALAYQKSRLMRNNIRSNDAFLSAFPNTRLARDAKKVSEWRLEGGGGLIAAGVAGSLTGKGAKIAVIDDPLKGRKSAESEKVRQAAIDWLKSDLFTRLEPDGILVMVGTRWHLEDPFGWIEKLTGDEDNPLEGFNVIKLSIAAICEDETNDPMHRKIGDSFWASRWTREKLLRNKRILGEYNWSALYQQQPLPREGGGFFPRDAIQTITHLPTRVIRRVRAWDFGGTSDYTVGVLLALLEDGRYVVENVIRRKGGSLNNDLLLLETAKNDGRDVTITIPQDPGEAGKTLARTRVTSLAGYQVSIVRPQGEKSIRATAFSSQWQASNVLVIAGQWVNAYLEEMHNFPSGANDDQVDASSDAFNTLFEPVQEIFFGRA
jgi:predicted phage terminase large subunit-like protein